MTERIQLEVMNNSTMSTIMLIPHLPVPHVFTQLLIYQATRPLVPNINGTGR